MKTSFKKQPGSDKKQSVSPTVQGPTNGRGFTLLEMTVVICVLLTLIGAGLYVGGAIGDWRKGRTAAEALRNVYSAQRMFLADNPTADVTTITPAQIIPYLPDRATALPVITPLKGAALTIRITTVPPVLMQGGTEYDPSGKANDNIWDVGE